MNKRSLSRWCAVVVVSGLLAACGGGGGPPPTAIPENLSISAPGTVESATAVRFANSTGALAGLKYGWEFGDGGTSTEASPDHSFSTGGEFDVVLRVTNEAGTSREVRSKVTVTNIANVRGLVCTGADSTGWCWQAPRPTGNRVNTVFFLDANVGWRAGDLGEILKTTDGGVTWSKQNSGVSVAIQGIAFLNAQAGWATGESGTVLRTTDGGSTWKADKLPDATNVSYDASAITPIDANTVYLGSAAGNGGYGAMFASTDAGVSWRQVTPAPAFITKTGTLWTLDGSVVKRSVDGGKVFSSVMTFVNPVFDAVDSISLTARDDLRAALLSRHYRYDTTAQKLVYSYRATITRDGGVSWQTTLAAGLSSYGTGLRVTSVSEDGKVLSALANLNVVLRSVDGGENWTSSGAIDPTSADGLTLTSLGSNAFAAVGHGGVFLSEDGGQLWLKLKLPTGVESSTLAGLGLRRVGAQTLLLTDAAGNIYLTRDKGTNWSVVVVATWGSQLPPSVAFRDAKNGVMVDEKGRLLVTNDGGASWQVRRADFGVVSSLQFVSKQAGWLVGSDGRVHKSSDGGESWLTEPVTQGTHYSSVKFEDDKLGWARRSGSSSYSLAITQDGGQTWAEQKLPNSIGSLRLGAQAWVAGGSAGEVYVSKDKGITWKPASSGTSAYLYALTSSDPQTFWAVGQDGTLLKSDDAGLTWSALRPSGNTTLRDIKFANAKAGWVVGDNGLILVTIDGGKTWRVQASGTTAALSRIQVVDGSTAWITGAGGVLLATGNGGN